LLFDTIIINNVPYLWENVNDNSNEHFFGAKLFNLALIQHLVLLSFSNLKTACRQWYFWFICIPIFDSPYTSNF